MDPSTLLNNYREFRSSLSREGVINDTFLELEELQDDTDPHFAFDTIDLFLHNAEHLLRETNKAVVNMRQINLVLADAYVHQLKGSTSCLGVTRLRNLTEAFRTFYLEGSVDGCLRTVKDLNQEYVYCKGRLQLLKRHAEQVWATGGTTRTI